MKLCSWYVQCDCDSRICERNVELLKAACFRDGEFIFFQNLHVSIEICRILSPR